MRGPDEAEDGEALLGLREELPGPLRHVLRQGRPTRERPVAVARAVAVGDEPALSQAIRDVLPADPHLRSLLPRLGADQGRGLADVGSPEEEGTAREPSVAERVEALIDSKAYEAVLDLVAEAASPLEQSIIERVLVSALELDSPEAAGFALGLAERELHEPVADIVWSSRMVGVAVGELQKRFQSPDDIPRDWREWFERVASGEAPPSEALDGAADWMPLPADEFLSRLEALTDPVAVSPVLGRMRAAHAPLLDERGRSRTARTLLAVLAFSDRPDASIRSATQELVAESLETGLTAEEGTDLVATVRELIFSQLSIGTVPWTIDIRSEMGDALAVSHREVLASLDRELLSRLRPLASAIPRADWEALRSLFGQVGVALPPDIDARLQEKGEPDPLARLAGKKLLLYSLRERSARQAAARIRRIEDAEVTLSADHVGSPQLAGQVAGADVVVVVTAAAKHAATEFIEACGPRQLIRVNSAGMSAILNGLEEACAMQIL